MRCTNFPVLLSTTKKMKCACTPAIAVECTPSATYLIAIDICSDDWCQEYSQELPMCLLHEPWVDYTCVGPTLTTFIHHYPLVLHPPCTALLSAFLILFVWLSRFLFFFYVFYHLLIRLSFSPFPCFFLLLLCENPGEFWHNNRVIFNLHFDMTVFFLSFLFS